MQRPLQCEWHAEYDGDLSQFTHACRKLTLEAARLRFRPIVMTSLAFMLGVARLAVLSGAGSAARQSMDTGVFGGMLVATFVATVFVPTFFTLVARRRLRRAGGHVQPDGQVSSATRSFIAMRGLTRTLAVPWHAGTTGAPDKRHIDRYLSPRRGDADPLGRIGIKGLNRLARGNP